nr:hypothetical protein [Tanacetum cinerariifolium]
MKIHGKNIPTLDVPRILNIKMMGDVSDQKWEVALAVGTHHCQWECLVHFIPNRFVKERFATTKPKNFSNDFLLITLGAMLEKPDIHAQIWKNQRSVHGQAKVKSWKLLESCGVQIITFTTTQLIFFGVDAAMDLKKKHAKCLMLLVKDLVLPSQDDAALEISKLKKKVKRLEKGNKVKGRMIDELDKYQCVALTAKKEEERKTKEAKNSAVDDQVKGRQAKIYQIDMDHPLKVLSMQEDEPAKVEEVVEVVTTTKLITKVVFAASKSVSAANTTIPAAEPQVPAATPTAVQVRVTAASTRRRKGVVIRDPEEEPTTKTPADTKSKDKGKGIMVEEPKPMKKKQQVAMDEEYARKLHEELNHDIDWDVTIDHVKQKAKEDPYVQRMLLDSNWTTSRECHMKIYVQFSKPTKRRKLNEEVVDLNKHLEIVPNKDDDVFTEDTLLARKVPVVDYSIIFLNNKPHYKFIKADGTHQLCISFLTLLKNFDRDDLELLWSIVKERLCTTKPDYFTDDFLLTTLRTMFEEEIPTLKIYVGSNAECSEVKSRRAEWDVLRAVKVHKTTVSRRQLNFGVDAAKELEEKH